MKGRTDSGEGKMRFFRSVTQIGAVCGFIAYVCFLWPGPSPAWACNANGLKKKTVILEKKHVEAEQAFSRECSRCHSAPDPVKPSCTAGGPVADSDRITSYTANVRTGKGLYEENCGECHKLIDPGTHTFDFWSKNLCTSDDVCIMKKKLNSVEEQQLLLYLAAHAKKE